MTVREEVLQTINRVYHTGLTTTSGGNISAIDKDGHIFITPSGIDKGTLKLDDIVEVEPDGTRIGKYAPSMELPFHSNIYKLRKDIKGVVHAHAPAVVAYATTHAVPNSKIARCFEDSLGAVSGSVYDLPGSLKLGDIVKEQFKNGYNAVMMDNHGATVGAENLEVAFCKYETLEFLCQTLINAQILGKAFVPTSKCKLESKKYEVYCESADKEEKLAKQQITEFLIRSYTNKLVGSEFGTIAIRLGADKFVFNADCDDRKLLTSDKIVTYKEGKLSADKGSIYAPIIKNIFDTHSEVNCVYISMPPATMGFAVAHQKFDSKLIPESYIMLKEVTQLPCSAMENNGAEIVKAMSTSAPAMVVENECAITLGRNITKAFDRMEVLEYSARSVIMAKSIAKIVPINDVQVKEINDSFNGW